MTTFDQPPVSPAAEDSQLPLWAEAAQDALAAGDDALRVEPRLGGEPDRHFTGGNERRNLTEADRLRLAQAHYLRAIAVALAEGTERLGALTEHVEAAAEPGHRLADLVADTDLKSHLEQLVDAARTGAIAAEESSGFLDVLAAATNRADERRGCRTSGEDAGETDAAAPWFGRPLRWLLLLFGVRIRFVDARRREESSR